MKNYTIRVVNANTGNCLYSHTIQMENKNEAMSAFMKFVQIDTEEGDVFLSFAKDGMMAVTSKDEEIEYYLIYG